MQYYVHHFSPFLWQWGDSGWWIRYYGVAYVLGFVAFYVGMLLFYKWKWSSLNPDQVSDLLVWAFVGVLVGGRLGYCLVYDLPRTLHDPLSIIAFWRGGISGMSSHGGMVGVILAFIFYARKVKTSFWVLADHAAILVTIGIFFGRIANFVNGELWGRPTMAPWAVIFSSAGQEPRHPSQIYEALGEGAFLFFILFTLRWLGWTNGKVAIVFLALYGAIRIFLENFREPDAQIGFIDGLTMGQILSMGMILAAIVLWIVVRKSELRIKN